MPRDGEIHGTPLQWLGRAKADLVLARIPLPSGGRYEDLCYHAQQAAEKAIKAVFRARKLGFTFTHNIGQLLLELEDHGIRYPREIEQAVPLTEYAHQTRYPGIVESVSGKERDMAVSAAELVVAWAESIVSERPR